MNKLVVPKIALDEHDQYVEVEITPEMIEVGVNVLLDELKDVSDGFSNPYKVIVQIFQKMSRARRRD